MMDLEKLQQLLRADGEIDLLNLDRRRREMIEIDVGLSDPWVWAQLAINRAWGVHIDRGPPHGPYINTARFEDARYDDISQAYRCFPHRPTPLARTFGSELVILNAQGGRGEIGFLRAARGRSYARFLCVLTSETTAVIGGPAYVDRHDMYIEVVAK